MSFDIWGPSNTASVGKEGLADCFLMKLNVNDDDDDDDDAF